MAEECGSTDIRVVSKIDSPYPFLYVCDTVVTHRSAVGLEGLLLGKPLIIVNFCGTPDAFPHVANGVATGAYHAAEVESAIHLALFDRATQAGMAERRSSFLRRYIAVSDISATERMVDLAMSSARNRAASSDFIPVAAM